MCPRCNLPMFQVHFGDGVIRWRCFECDAVFSSIEWIENDGEFEKIGWWRGLRKERRIESDGRT